MTSFFSFAVIFLSFFSIVFSVGFSGGSSFDDLASPFLFQFASLYLYEILSLTTLSVCFRHSNCILLTPSAADASINASSVLELYVLSTATSASGITCCRPLWMLFMVCCHNATRSAGRAFPCVSFPIRLSSHRTGHLPGR